MASVQSELGDSAVDCLRRRVLDQVYENSLCGVLIDLSGVEIIDSFGLRKLVDIAKMTRLLGAETRFTGIRPEVVASLVDLGTVSSDFVVVADLDAGLAAFSERT